MVQSFPSFPIRRRLKGSEVASLIRDPVFLLAPDRSILHWNLAAARALNVEGLPAGDATVAESPRLARLAELLSHVDGPFMLTLDAPDGERTYLADLHEEGSDQDAPTSLILLLHDHTELINLQKALRESENRLRAITGAAMEAIIAMDNKGRIQQWNPAAERMFGWTASEAIGRSLHATLAGPAERARFHAASGAAAWSPEGEGRSYCSVLCVPALRKDGSSLEVEVSISTYRMEGHWQALGIVRDVTERARAEARLKAAEERWQFALEGGGDAVWDWNVVSGEAYFAPRYYAMLGYEENAFEPSFESFRALVHPDDWFRVVNSLRTAFEPEGPLFECEFRMRTPDDACRWVSSRGLITERSPDGQPLRMVGTLRDVHERHEAEAALLGQLAETQRLNAELEEAQVQLVQSEKMASIGQLSAGVAHEMNTPLGFVKSNIGTLENYVGTLLELLAGYQQATAGMAGVPELDEVREPLALAELDYLRSDIPELFSETRDGIQRVQRIVSDLKDFSHLGGEGWGYADIHRGLDSSLNILRNEIKHRADVVREYASLPELWCQSSQLNQVFLNLLANAAHAIEGRGRITVRTRVEGEFVVVEIEDTGCGIPPENLKRIFDAFFTTKPVGKGTGLGLSISYGIIRKHSGRIEVSSRPGHGSTFQVFLPLHGSALGATDESALPGEDGSPE